MKFVVMGTKTTLVCGDGQKREFVGSSRVTFSGVVTCVVQIDAARGAVQVSRASTVTCQVQGTQVACAGM